MIRGLTPFVLAVGGWALAAVLLSAMLDDAVYGSVVALLILATALSTLGRGGRRPAPLRRA